MGWIVLHRDDSGQVHWAYFISEEGARRWVEWVGKKSSPLLIRGEALYAARAKSTKDAPESIPGA